MRWFRYATLLLLAVRPAAALHQESPPVIALTGGAPLTPPGRAWGNWLAFVSTEDLAGLGSARVPGKQVFVFNLAYYDCARGTTFPTTPCPPPGTPALLQATNGPGDPDNASIADTPSSSSGGHWLAFDAEGRFSGLTGPAGGRRQVYLLNLRTSELRAVTTAADGDSVRPAVSHLAGLVVFESTAALAGFANPGGTAQVYAWERTSNVLRRISIGPPPANQLARGPSSDAVTNRNGTLVAFASRADLLGSGADTGVWQIYLASYDSQQHTSQLTQITAGNGSSRRPFLGEGPSGANNALVFESAATSLPGAPGAPGTSVVAVALPTQALPSVQRLTTPAIFGDCVAPTIDASGERVAFACSGDPLQNGTSGWRLFVLDRATARLSQLTGRGTVTPPLRANLGEWFLSAVTTSDLLGTGTCAPRLYVFDYYAGKWAAATQLGQVPPDVFAPNGCAPSCATPADCDDGNPCTGVESCVAGLCRPGTPVACSDGNACNGIETCDPGSGACLPGVPLACDDGNPCNGAETCVPAQGCVAGTPVVCSDGNACNGIETCNPATGSCQGGSPPVCDDGNPCTDDSCIPATGCAFTPNTNPCDDSDACTLGDRCQGGVCEGTPVTCSPCQRCEEGACITAPAPLCGSGGPRFAAQLLFRRRAQGSFLAWKWLRGPAIAPEAFGNPLRGDEYALCVYDGTGELVFRAVAPGGGVCGVRPCWRPVGFTGWQYTDPEGTPEGLRRVRLRAGAAGASRLVLKGKGPYLSLPPLGTLGLPLRTQLQASGGSCWEAVFSSQHVLRHEPEIFEARR